MRIKTTPTKSRKRTPMKNINFGGGMGNSSVITEGAFSNKPTTPNVFSNAPSAFATNLTHFYDEILLIDQLLDLDNLAPPSRIVS